VAKKSGSFDRGDIVWLDFAPTLGHEQTGRRPVLVLSPQNYNDASGLLLVCPITSKVKGYPFEVPITGKIKGAVLANHVRSVASVERNAKLAGKATTQEILRVKNMLELLLP
jgi:mRNA interferase MazF